jgi:predicted RNA-binding Zn-ribbon protein involved in translation (DUF1610 family)
MSREIENECAFCGQRVSFPEEGAGQTAACPQCGKSIILGLNPIEALESDEAIDFAVKGDCPHCRRRITFLSGISKEIILCPQCGMSVYLGNVKTNPFRIKQDQLDALVKALKIRLAEEKEIERKIQEKSRQILKEKTEDINRQLKEHGGESHPVFEGVSCLVQLLVIAGIIIIIIAFSKFVLFWAFQ